MITNYLSKIIDGNKTIALEKRRLYVGASSIGSLCARFIWYGYHTCTPRIIDSRRRRTLEIGNRLESILVEALIDAGIKLERPSKDNNFLEFYEKRLTEFRGHADALWRGVAIIEIKTAKDSSFKIFQKKGLRLWYPSYFAQVQSYMGMSGVHMAYVLAINKDTSELHDECIVFDERYYESLVEKAKAIIESPEKPPEKISRSPIYFMCRMCDYRNVCHGTED